MKKYNQVQFKKHREFKGELFKLEAVTWTKTNALKTAQALRDKGKKVRTRKQDDMFLVYAK